MNIWDHSTLSVRKFGGIEKDYYEVHKFMDSSKLFYYHVKHRLLLHNLYGIEIAIMKFGDTLKTSDGQTLLIRDITAEHCKEDLSGKVPSLNEWLVESEERIGSMISIPTFKNPELEKFVLLPYQRSGLKSSLIISLSNFGVYLTGEILGQKSAKELQELLHKDQLVENYLKHFQFTKSWQFNPDRKELEWLKNYKEAKENKME